ncbi:MAG: dTMP kinase [Caldilineae bacterium]|nr:MAG: dTMP kinase [Caldilineae bacterium]
MSRFITFEGPDGAGKSTQIALLAEYLTRQGYAVHCTREPGGTPIGDQIRRVLHDVANTQMSPIAEILLYSASRAQLTAQVIKPLLAAGTIVLCDRYADSTFAYQGYGRGLDMETLQAITRFATGGLKPDLTIFLDLPVEVGLSRKKEASEAGEGEFNRMDRLTVDFHRRVRAGYLAMSRAEPQRWVVLDACRPVEAIQSDIRRALHTLGLGEAKP